MGVGSSYQDAMLTAMIAAIPSGSRWAIFSGDPENGGTELTSAGGYISPSYTSGDFTVSGGQATASPDFGTSTGAYSDNGDYWALLDSSDAPVFADDFPPSAIVVIDDSGIPVQPDGISLFFGTAS